MANSESVPEGAPPQQPEDLSRISPKEQPTATTPEDDLNLDAILSGAKERLNRIEGTLENTPTAPDTTPTPAPAAPRPRGVITDNVEPPVETPDETLPAPAQPPRRARQPRGAGGTTPSPATTTRPAPTATEAPTPATTVNPETPREVPVPETLEQQALDRGTAFFYQFMTGEKKSAPEARKQLESLGLFTVKEGVMSASTKELIARSTSVEDAKLALFALVAESQKKENRENGVKKAHFESETRKARLELEHRLDEMKFAWMKQWEKDNRERNPSLTKKELHEESITYNASAVFRAATNFYPKLAEEEGALIARTPAEKGLLQRYGEWVNNAPRWKRVAVSAAIAGGTTVAAMSLFSTAGIPMIAGIAGWRSLRAATSTGLAAGITAGIEKFFGERFDARGKRKREQAREKIRSQKEGIIDKQAADYEQVLRAELAGKPEWLADRAIALAVMKKVDTDAKVCADERGKIFSAQERAAELIGTKWRRRLAIGTGLAVGGGMALSAVDWDRVPEWIGGIKKSAWEYFAHPTAPKVAGGGGGILDHARATILGWCPDASPSIKLPDPYPICDPTETNVLTIHEGSSVWRTAQHFVGETVQGPDGPVKITKDMVRSALGNSTVEMVTEHGKHIQVPVLETGLVHAGDQVALVHEGGGWKIWVGDYAKDHYHAGNNALFKQIHEANGLPVANWMHEGTTPPAKLLETHTGLLARIRDTYCTKLGITSGGGGAITSSGAIETGMSLIPESPEPLFTPDGVQEMTRSFGSATPFEQQQTLEHITKSIADIQETIATPIYPPEALSQMTSYHNELLNVQQSLMSSPDYLANITDLGNVLETHDIATTFFADVENMRMSEFVKMSGRLPSSFKSTGLEAMFKIYYEDAAHLRNLFTELNPGKAELRMSVGQFIKTNLDAFAVSRAV